MLAIPPYVQDRLARGHQIGAEVLAGQDGRRAFVVVLPDVPDPHKHPEAWLGLDGVPPRLTMQLRDPRSVRGYEVRHLEHDAKFTDQEWGSDYDLVLADPSTRVRRTFVQSEAELAEALAPWSSFLRDFVDAMLLDCPLVGPIDWYLEQPERYPHLTQ
jgi:hypothetical protein